MFTSTNMCFDIFICSPRKLHTKPWRSLSIAATSALTILTIPEWVIGEQIWRYNWVGISRLTVPVISYVGWWRDPRIAWTRAVRTCVGAWAFSHSSSVSPNMLTWWPICDAQSINIDLINWSKDISSKCICMSILIAYGSATYILWYIDVRHYLIAQTCNLHQLFPVHKLSLLQYSLLSIHLGTG